MNVGLIDVDNFNKLDKCFPNIPLMKISSYIKNGGGIVEWWKPEKHYDVVFKSKVFTFTDDIDNDLIDADEIIQGGSGYYIHLKDGKEHFDKEHHQNLPYEIEHSFPDYDLYGISNTAYGFMSRGCPRGCDFCHVKDKEGRCSVKVADLNEFWNGQKNVELLDPNTFACKDWKIITDQLIESGAKVNFSQGVDIRVMNEEKIRQLMKINVNHVHFAWDRYEDKELIVPRLKKFKEISGWGRNKVSCYVLTNFNTTFEQDIERVMILRQLNFNPYIMRYDKEHIKKGSKINKLARWVNFKALFWKYDSFEEYVKDNYKNF